MITTSSIFLVVCFFSTAWSITPNYYWRDYDGTIPSDAIRGGNLNGSVTYIGSIPAMLRRDDPVQDDPVQDDPVQYDTPGTVSALIIPGNRTAYATYGPEVLVNDRAVKILCTTEPQRFVWTKQLGANCVHVRGSYMNSNALYIGRASYEGHVRTGRVAFDPKALYIPRLASPYNVESIRDFETLAYC